MRSRSSVLIGFVALVAGALGCMPARPDPAVRPIDLAIDGRVHQPCASLGGCAYGVEFVTADATYHAVLAQTPDGLVPKVGLPATFAPGTASVVLTARAMSDLVTNGQRTPFAIDSTCRADLPAEPGVQSVSVHVTFTLRSCSIELRVGMS